MTRDPVAAQFPIRTRIRWWTKRVVAWKRWIQLFGMTAVASLAIGLVAINNSGHEQKARTQQLQDAFCGTPKIPGLLPTILEAQTTPTTSQLGRQILAGARHAAEIVHCPGVR